MQRHPLLSGLELNLECSQPLSPSDSRSLVRLWGANVVDKFAGILGDNSYSHGKFCCVRTSGFGMRMRRQNVLNSNCPDKFPMVPFGRLLEPAQDLLASRARRAFKMGALRRIGHSGNVLLGRHSHNVAIHSRTPKRWSGCNYGAPGDSNLQLSFSAPNPHGS